SRKLRTPSSCASSDSTSRCSSSSPPHASCRNALLNVRSRSSAAWQRSSILRHLSGVIPSSSGHFSAEPEFGQPPVVQDGARSNLEHFCGFLHAQPSKVTQLHYLAFPWVHFSQGFHGVIQGHEVLMGCNGSHPILIQSDIGGAASTLLVAAG